VLNKLVVPAHAATTSSSSGGAVYTVDEGASYWTDLVNSSTTPQSWDITVVVYSDADPELTSIIRKSDGLELTLSIAWDGSSSEYFANTPIDPGSSDTVFTVGGVDYTLALD